VDHPVNWWVYFQTRIILPFVIVGFVSSIVIFGFVLTGYRMSHDVQLLCSVALVVTYLIIILLNIQLRIYQNLLAKIITKTREALSL
jgi:hypothetical protein